jgi:hypothetical protein
MKFAPIILGISSFKVLERLVLNDQDNIELRHCFAANKKHLLAIYHKDKSAFNDIEQFLFKALQYLAKQPNDAKAILKLLMYQEVKLSQGLPQDLINLARTINEEVREVLRVIIGTHKNATAADMSWFGQEGFEEATHSGLMGLLYEINLITQTTDLFRATTNLLNTPPNGSPHFIYLQEMLQIATITWLENELTTNSHCAKCYAQLSSEEKDEISQFIKQQKETLNQLKQLIPTINFNQWQAKDMASWEKLLLQLNPVNQLLIEAELYLHFEQVTTQVPELISIDPLVNCQSMLDKLIGIDKSRLIALTRLSNLIKQKHFTNEAQLIATPEYMQLLPAQQDSIIKQLSDFNQQQQLLMTKVQSELHNYNSPAWKTKFAQLTSENKQQIRSELHNYLKDKLTAKEVNQYYAQFLSKATTASAAKKKAFG